MNTKLLSRIGFLAIAAPVLLIGAACSFVDSDSSSGGTNNPADEVAVVDAPIDEVEVIVRESAPPQYAVRIVSGQPSGCAQFNDAEVVGREGNTIKIKVTNTEPADMTVVLCTAIYGTTESTLDLGSDFESGETYILDINGELEEFVAQ